MSKIERSKNIFTLFNFDEFPVISDFIEDGVVDSRLFGVIDRINDRLVHCLDSQMPNPSGTVRKYLSTTGLKCAIDEFLNKVKDSVEAEELSNQEDREKLIEDLDRGLEDCTMPCMPCPASPPTVTVMSIAIDSPAFWLHLLTLTVIFQNRIKRCFLIQEIFIKNRFGQAKHIILKDVS